ncbi:ribosome rescue GTPase HflX [Methylocaldum szegediense]|uniref:GTPase HflX n=1 Tax=Methylocaldum szegediense TaxID=73780 RepID=A0ABN8X1K0_9GAMM|nr:ribosome rescue GTPase HflX [Methylocaldum szegediense]CAI8727986.1 ribosome rescue factor HflX [Methylocaldum szegediense]
MFERPKSGERAVLVHMAAQDETDALEELQELAVSAGAEPVAIVMGRRHAPDPRYYIGKGKLDELVRTVRENEAELVLFNHPLTPSQQRNLEKELSVRVVDRTELILDIFAQRAQSFEGKLQVELAQLRHLSTRLVRGWTHLERQKGGIGLRGPGETQLEMDKRLIGDRIRQIQKRLERVERQREQGRSARRRAELPVVSLVGYTNAGKSTLFNALTGAGVYAADQLFATLDPTLRRLQLAPNLTVILADTVGFIRHLPHELIAAFRSTLKEAADADLLLHVIDVSDERADETVSEVNRVLCEIGADHVKQIQIFNKIDRIGDVSPRVEKDENGEVKKIWLSAQTGWGVPLLRQALESYLGGGVIRRRVRLNPANAGLRARLYEAARILREEPDGSGGWNLDVELLGRNVKLLRELDNLIAPTPRQESISE